VGDKRRGKVALSLSLERERGRGEARRAGAMTINLDDVCIRSRLIIG